MLDKKAILEKFREKFPGGAWSDPDDLAVNIMQDIESFLLSTIDLVERETAKAYGGCVKCYGKGYSTYKEGYSAQGTHWTEDQMLYCGCSRGKQLKAILSPDTQEEKKECVCVYPNAVMYHKGLCKYRQDPLDTGYHIPYEYMKRCEGGHVLLHGLDVCGCCSCPVYCQKDK